MGKQNDSFQDALSAFARGDIDLIRFLFAFVRFWLDSAALPSSLCAIFDPEGSLFHIFYDSD